MYEGEFDTTASRLYETDSVGTNITAGSDCTVSRMSFMYLYVLCIICKYIQREKNNTFDSRALFFYSIQEDVGLRNDDKLNAATSKSPFDCLHLSQYTLSQK